MVYRALNHDLQSKGRQIVSKPSFKYRRLEISRTRKSVPEQSNRPIYTDRRLAYYNSIANMRIYVSKDCWSGNVGKTGDVRLSYSYDDISFL